jgi:hypothetical protein
MNNTPGKNTELENKTGDHFESDTQKIVRRHLEDKNHVITEDEIRSVRVGMTPPLDEIDNAELRSGSEEEQAGKTGADASDAPLTPWDAVEP